MRDDLLIRRAAVFQHVLDEVDAATRTVEFIAKRHIGGARRGTEPAMHAAAEDLFGLGHMGIGKLFCGEGGLHCLSPHLAGAEDTGWVEFLFYAGRQGGQPIRQRFESRCLRPHLVGGPNQCGMPATKGADGTAQDLALWIRFHAHPDKPPANHKMRRYRLRGVAS